MRFSTVPLVVVGASLAIQAGAVPLRVVVVSSLQEINTHNNPDPNIFAAMPGPAMVPGAGMMNVDDSISAEDSVQGAAGGRHCGSLREQAMRFTYRIFGFPKIAIDAAAAPTGQHDPEPGRVSILPWFGPAANDVAHAETDEGMMKHHAHPMMPPVGHNEAPGEDVVPVRIVHMSEQEGGRRRFRHRHGPFIRRMHFALMALGPWEGRAVAFVLGCGIGVLLRMIWVMGVVLVRAMGGRRNDDDAEAVFDADAEEIIVAPPQYTEYSEKTPVPVEMPAQTN